MNRFTREPVDYIGGASKAERDALKLFAVFIQHSSNKSINQRIVCTDPPACTHTTMMISDVGKSFGAANAGNIDAKAAANFKEWSGAHVWKLSSGCLGNLHWTWSGSLSDPLISEPGRKLLADQLRRIGAVEHHLHTCSHCSPKRDLGRLLLPER